MEGVPDKRAFQRALDLFDEIVDLDSSDCKNRLREVELSDPQVGPILRAMLDGDRRDGILNRGIESVVGEAFADSFADAAPEGRMVGHYRLLRRIGQGGMGEVFEAERADGEFDQRVAIKLLRWGAGGPSAEARFFRERRILARLEHSGIARVLDGGGGTDGHPYLVMEFIDGEALDVYCDRLALSIEQRLRIFVEICRVVSYAHRQLVVHRDLKPSNILVDSLGRVHLLDFGIAKLLEGDTDDGLTQVGQRPMTPDFAAPEQMEGGAISTATDVYALGLLLFELLAGRTARSEVDRSEDAMPLRPSSALTRSKSENEGELVDLATLRGLTPRKLQRRLRGDLDRIVLKALRWAPEDRYASTDAMAQDVERHLAGYPIQARNVGWVVRSLALARRNRGVAVACIAVVVAIVAGIASTLHQARERSRQAEITEAVSAFLLDLFADSEPVRVGDSGMTALELLERGAARVEHDDVAPEVRYRLMEEIGWVYFQLGEFRRAEDLNGRALSTARALFGPDSPQAHKAERLWATCLWRLGRFDEAESALLHSLEIAERHRDDPEVGETYSALAALNSSMGRFEEAESMHRHALAISEKVYGRRSRQVGTDLVNLGVALWNQGQLGEAEATIRRSLDIALHVSGVDSALAADGYHNLGSILVDEQEFDEAELCFREAVRLREGIYGENHPDLIPPVSGLSSILVRQGRNEEALGLAERAVSMARQVYGSDHSVVAVQLNNLAKRWYTLGDLDRAANAMGEALEIWERTLPPGHSDLTVGLGNLGMIYFANGNLDRAETLLRESIDHERKNNPPNPERLALSLCNLGRVLSAGGHHDEAVARAVEAMRMAQEELDPAHGLIETISRRLEEIRQAAGEDAS